MNCFIQVWLFAALLTVACQGILQARILEWVAVSSSRGFSWPRDQTHISCLVHWQVGFFPVVPLGKPQIHYTQTHVHMYGLENWEKLNTNSFNRILIYRMFNLEVYFAFQRRKLLIHPLFLDARSLDSVLPVNSKSLLYHSTTLGLTFLFH